MPKIKLKLMGPMTPWTKTPNIFIDKLMPMLTDSQLRILIILLRSTVGWNREGEAVVLSYNMLMARSGRSSEAISRALKSLEAQGFIHIARGKQRTLRLKAKEVSSENEALYNKER